MGLLRETQLLDRVVASHPHEWAIVSKRDGDDEGCGVALSVLPQDAMQGEDERVLDDARPHIGLGGPKWLRRLIVPRGYHVGRHTIGDRTVV